MRSAIAHVLLCLSMWGCGGPRMRGGELYAGRASAEPSMRCLPDPDIETSEYTRRMREGLELAEESFSVPAPPAPSSRSTSDLSEWAEGPLRHWLASKSSAVEAARRELDAAAEENHRQRIIGGAVVGLMYEDVARVIGNVPAPTDLDDEPEIMRVYRDTLRRQSQPYLETSRRAYRACAQNAAEPVSMNHWASFCSERARNLPAEPLESGETQVEVIADE